MEGGITTLHLGAIGGLQEESIKAEKYMILWDKNGNCGTFFEYKASRHEIFKSILAVSTGKKTTDDVHEELRKHIVGGALHGKCVVLDIGKLSGNILAQQPSTPDVWPADKIWNFKEWRKQENHMAVVKDDENISTLGSTGCYSM